MFKLKRERSRKNSLTLHLRELEKVEQTKSKVSRSEKIARIGTEMEDNREIE